MIQKADRILLAIPDDAPLDQYECIKCGEGFSQDEWPSRHAGDPWGGFARHECPQCEEETVSVTY